MRSLLHNNTIIILSSVSCHGHHCFSESNLTPWKMGAFSYKYHSGKLDVQRRSGTVEEAARIFDSGFVGTKIRYDAGHVRAYLIYHVTITKLD